MKRSKINAALRKAEAILAEQKWAMPDFANWTPADHAANPDRSRWLAERQVGWDVTDFGSGDFDKIGLVLFCARNGIYGVAEERPYAEKLLFVEVGQEAPFHAHKMKLEDMIVRGGGTLCVEFTAEGSVQPITGEAVPDTVRIDGQEVPAYEGPHRLTAGQSVTIPRGMQHRLWCEDAPIFVAEVSQCNDDMNDNYFLKPAGRFSTIEEDEAPYRLLWNEGTTA